ncbi:MAG TPA: D-cysteine desulfhydrase family protein [Fimbriimonas sp.]|nr:D-cysteine desulfhydrase family protein [Fimbriimonas sp.]
MVAPIPKLDLILAPTPLHHLPRMSETLGIDLWIKRDDLTGFAFGGNKGRKLEYLLAAAKAEGADTIVTCGSAQSNFIRQLAAGCSMLGIKLVAVVMQLPYEDEPPIGAMMPTNGNVLLDDLLGAELVLLPNGTWDELFESTRLRAELLRAAGKQVFEIPIGGSSPLGAYAFEIAGQELLRQAIDFDYILSASSSGSTQTGLTRALHKSTTTFVGVGCDPEPEMIHEFAALSAKVDELCGTNLNLKAEDFRFDTRFVGPGYGVPSESGMAALRLIAQTEGIFLDPIYSAKAFDGLIHMARNNELSGKVCFWHTGGTPALFAMPA